MIVFPMYDELENYLSIPEYIGGYCPYYQPLLANINHYSKLPYSCMVND